MITVHHAPNSRSTRILWLLEELGAKYKINYVDIARRDGSGGPDPKNPHPLKQAPAITHHGETINESAIIVSHLADSFPEAGLAPKHGTPERAKFDKWLGLYAGVLEPVVTARFQKAATAVHDAAYEFLDAEWRAAVASGRYVMGEFSAVDILFSSLLSFYRAAMPDHKEYDDYLERVSSRPAFKAAMAKNAKPD